MPLQRFKRKRLASSKMTINHHLPWSIKALGAALILGVGAAVAMWTYELGSRYAFGPQITKEEIQAIQAEIANLKEDKEKLLKITSTIDSQQAMDKTMQKELSEQVTALTKENTRLKEELTAFESLMPASTRPQGISLQKTKVEMLKGNQLKYQTLVMQAAPLKKQFAATQKEFTGELRISLALVQSGKPVVVEYPDKKAEIKDTKTDGNKFKLAFHHYQKMEGQINLPEGAVLKSVTFSVMEKGELRTKQQVNL